jgi:hypothetical protein
MEYLGDAMLEQCPHLKLHYCDDRTGIDNIVTAPQRSHMSVPYENGTFNKFIASVIEKENVTAINASNLVAINFGDSYLGWNYKETVELTTIRKALFKALKFNRGLFNISTQILQSPKLRDAFIAIHLRGKHDWPAFFGSVDDQMRLYTSELENIQHRHQNETKAVYVSCGDPAAIQWFRESISLLGYTVHDKWSLLLGQPEIS